MTWIFLAYRVIAEVPSGEIERDRKRLLKSAPLRGSQREPRQTKTACPRSGSSHSIPLDESTGTGNMERLEYDSFVVFAAHAFAFEF
jgi:hypothetical protein